MFRFVDHSLIYCTEGLHAEPLAWTSERQDGSCHFSRGELLDARREMNRRAGLIPSRPQCALTEREVAAHVAQQEQGPTIDPRSKGESDPRDLDRDDHPLQVDSEDTRLASAWNRTRQIIRRYDEGEIDGAKLKGALDDVFADTGLAFAYPVYAGSDDDESDGKIVGYEWAQDGETALHLTTQEHLSADRATIAWLDRDTEDERREVARNSEMAPKDDEQDRPTRQGGQYTGTLETEYAMLLHSLRGLRGTYRSLLDAAVAKGFTIQRAKGHAQLVYKVNEAQAMIDRFNCRRMVNAIEQLETEPDFPAAWAKVMARKAETKVTYRTILNAYVAKVAAINRQALVGDDGTQYLGVEGLLRMESPKASWTRVSSAA